jgi:hypothetical protein
MIILKPINKANADLKNWMAIHYSKPKGFVGRQLIYAVYYNAGAK